MKLSEAWHLSRIPYGEVAYKSIIQTRSGMWWGSFGRSDPDKESRGDVEMAERALKIAKIDKLVVGVVSIITSIIPFASVFTQPPPPKLIIPISLSLAIAFSFIMLYAVQTLSSFVSAESSALLSTLPLTKDDFALITLLSFVRSVDYMVVGSIVSQVTLVAYLTTSPLATLLMLVASSMNVVFAVSIALLFSRLFYRNLLGGGRSKVSTALRLVFLLAWGLLVMGAGILFSIAWYVMPNLEKALLSLDSNPFFSILFPFSAGMTVASPVYPQATLSVTLAFAAMVGYIALAVVAGRWSLGVTMRISQGTGFRIARKRAEEFLVKVRSPLFGYVMKDLRISSGNPATAFFFALPAFEAVIVSLLMMGRAMLRASTILVATTMGGVVCLFMPLGLLNAEGMGLEYTKTLPVKIGRIVKSKALISTATYVPVPLALLGMAFMKSLTSPLAILIPFVTVLSIASASIIEIRLFLGFVAKRKIDTLIHDLGRLIVGVIIALIPEVAYVTTYLMSTDHLSAILIMGGVATAELAMASYLLRRS